MKLNWIEQETLHGEIEKWEAVEGEWRLLVVHLESGLEECWEWRVGHRQTGDGDSDIAYSREDAIDFAEDAIG